MTPPGGRRTLSGPPVEGHADAGEPARPKRSSFNEAAHKLGHWPVRESEPRREGPSEAIRAASDDDRDVVAHAGRAVLALGALGVVYGDLGTSPLYTEQTIFQQHANAATVTPNGVYGIASLIFWALLIEVSLKYAGFIMRAHNHGDGGVMALSALIQRRRVPRAAALITLGLLGAGLFLGDGMITPAISVTSAVGGLKVVSAGLAHLVVPISLAILVALFAVQRFGTGAVGWLFGPILLGWFVLIGVLGAHQVILHPSVLQGLSPTYAARFLGDHGADGWLTLGGVVLCITGAEAMYADRGHFGVAPIRLTWFSVVLP
ncbi:MAG: KUP/HAK/KT family potassium transporter, partial [Solirubrobacteraceae bacterium]